MKKEVIKNDSVSNDTMKKQIITFAIGVLVGAIITAGVFMIVSPRNSRRMPDMNNFKDFSKFDMNGTKGDFNGTRPKRPSGDRPSRNGKSRRSSNETIGDNSNEKY